MEHDVEGGEGGEADHGALAAALDRARLVRLHWTDAAVSWRGANTTRVPWPRITLTLEGERVLRRGRDGGSHDLRLPAGHAIVAAPYAQTETLPGHRGRSLGMVFRPGYVRVLSVAPEGKRWYHTARALAAPGHEVLSALMHLAEHDGDRSTALHLARALLCLVRTTVSEDRPPHDDATARFRRVVAWLEEHCHLPVDRTRAAAGLGLHPNSISRLFREHGDESFVACLTRLRLALARHLLRQTRAPVAEVAARSGFGDVGHFIRVFRRHHGTSPGRYRRDAADG